MTLSTSHRRRAVSLAVITTTWLAASAIAAEVNTAALSQNGWYSDDTRADGAGSQVAGTNLISPTLTDAPENTGGNENAAHDADITAQIVFGTATGVVPSGTFEGAVHLQIAPGSGSGKSQISHRKDDLTGHGPGSSFGPGFSAEYSWMGDGTASVTASLKFGIKTSEFGSAGVSSRTGENVWDKVLIYEPGNLNGGLSDGTWQTETIDWSTGKWWFFDRVALASTIGQPMTLEDMSTSTATFGAGAKTIQDVYNLITGGGAIVTAVQFGIGSGNAGGSVHVNQLETSFYRAGDLTTFGFGPPVLSLLADACETDGTVVVDIEASDLADLIVGGQFFLDYDNTKLDFLSADVGDAPFDIEVFEFVDEFAGTIDYAVGVFGGGPGTMSDTVMARLTFAALGELCTPTADLVTFRSHVPPTRLTKIGGGSVDPTLVDLNAIAIDTIAPVIGYCPPDVTISCVEDADPGILYGSAVGGVAIHYNDNGGGENPANQAYLTAQFSQPNANGAEYDFSAAPIAGIGLSWYGLYQVVPGQFGLDMQLVAPTWDGTVVLPPLVAYDNGDNSLPGAIADGPVAWAISGYTGAGNGPANPANGIINSLIRGDSPPSLGDVVITRNDLSLSGTVYTADIEGYLVSDGLHHWYTIATPDSPLSNFGLSGIFWFKGTLTYDSAGDDGTDLVDFYSGTIEITANFPSSSTGIPLATDNCTPVPAISYVDVDNGGSGAFGDPLVITRTWTFTDDCGNATDCVQTITVEDVTPPTFLSTPDDLSGYADAGFCSASYSLAEIGEPTATDDCDGGVVITWVRSDAAANLDDPFPVGTTTITWFADDGRGNVSSFDQYVDVDGSSLFDVTVALDGVVAAGPFDRCITFEFTQAGCVGTTVVATEMTFAGGTASGTIEIPCGDYVCVTARDTLHTLRMDDLDDFGISGTEYVADFTGGDALIGGNLNDDAYIDILDFGGYVGEFGASYGSGDTTCATAAIHADVNGNGTVSAADFTFIQVNFLAFAETGCCVPFAGPLDDARRSRRDRVGMTTGTGPVERVSVEALRRAGMHRLIAGDLNHDGWLDIADVAAFMGGARP